MAGAAERPNVLERLGSALNSSDLSPDESRSKPIDLIGALGLHQVNPTGDAHVAIEHATIDPRGELGPVLVRLKYGGDRGLGTRAEKLLILWIRHQRAYRNWKLKPGGDGLLERFARQGLAEWLFPVCQECKGRAFVGMDKGDVIETRHRCRNCKSTGRVRIGAITGQCPTCRGFKWTVARKPNTTKPALCTKCNGTGFHRVGDFERASALGVDLRVYERHWAKRFSWLAAAFDRIDGQESNCLRVQLSSG